MKNEIIFFDATETRRERMRSGGVRPKAEPRQIVSDEIVKSAAPESSAAPGGDFDKTTPIPAKIVAQPADVAKSADSSSELDAYLVNFVVEQTGYPEDMVELDADLEGDLGIDSIKKAQLLGELNEKFHFSTADDMNGATSLDDFATLRAIRDFIVERTSGASMPAQPSIDVKSNSVAEEPKIPSQSKPAAQPAAVAKSAVSSSELDAYLVNFVVEQTGYPEDMVELDADLEGDLGIDSIKKAQLLGELNEKFHFSTADDMNGATSLDDFATLRAIRDFIVERTSGASMPAQPSIDVKSNSVAEEPKIPSQSKPAAQSAAVAKSAVSSSELDAYLVNFVVEQTGYPEDMVELDADLEGDLGIDSIKKAQLLGELNEKFHFSTADDMNGATSLDDFATLRAIRDFIVERTSGVPTPTSQSSVSPEQQNIGSNNSESIDEKRKEILSYMKTFVVEQTGYPEDSVQIDYNLETDLGIDSIKKAQLFGELAEIYAVYPLADSSLEDYVTLRHIYDAVVKEL